MVKATPKLDASRSQITLGLLELVDRDGAQSQRRLAAELGVALGLVNAYLKRCINKGFVKVRQVPVRRYSYYLTPQGFAEKSRLSIEYLTSSLVFFRQAKADCMTMFAGMRGSGHSAAVLVGKSDLAEIAVICAIQSEVEVVGIVDPAASEGRLVGVPVFASFDHVDRPFDAAIVTDLVDPGGSVEKAVALFGVARVLVPEVLRGRVGNGDAAA